MIKVTKTKETCWKSWSGSGRPEGDGKCCCNCSNHIKVYSHPWVDGKPMSNQIGWVCANTFFGKKQAILCKKHGLCEMYQKMKTKENIEYLSAHNKFINTIAKRR